MFYEVFESNKTTGRTPFKIAMHEIHMNPDDMNKNGIHWKREYVERNMHTAKGAPFVAEFIDQDHDVPAGHGDVYVDENNEVYFENSVVVGVIEDTAIEEIEVNGKTIQALVANGYLFHQRFPNFVKWLRETSQHEIIKSSVEIGANPPNKTIMYEGGWKEKGRIPMDYQYTGHAILYTEEPADDSAVLLEINKVKEEINMSKENQNALVELNENLKTEVKELNTQLKEKEDEVREVNAKLEEKETELNELVQQMKDLEGKLEANEKELESLRTFKSEVENKELVNELNSKLSNFTDDEKEVAKDKIEKFEKEPSQSLLQEIVNEINSAIAKRIIEERAKQKQKQTSEVNSTQDIFGDVQDADTTEDIEDLL